MKQMTQKYNSWRKKKMRFTNSLGEVKGQHLNDTVRNMNQ